MGLQIDAIAAVHPLSGARQMLYQRGRRQVQTPGLPVAPADVAAFAAAPPDRLTPRLQTPLRLIDGDRLVKRFDPRPFVARMAWRLDQLAVAYGAGAPLIGPERLHDFAEGRWMVYDQRLISRAAGASTRRRLRTAGVEVELACSQP